MNFPFRTIAALLCAAALCFLVGCQSQESQMADLLPTTSEDAAALYLRASDAALSGQQLSMQLQAETETKIGDTVFTKRSDQSLTLTDPGTEAMQGVSVETFVSGSQSVTIQERYTDGMLYMTVNGSQFASPVTVQDYQARFVSRQVFTPSLYGTVTAAEESGSIRILFDAATGPESWAVPTDAQWISSGGSALLEAESKLLECTYTVCYRSGNAEITCTWQIAYQTEAVSPTEIPAVAEDAVMLTDARIPRLLEEVTGYLTQANTVSANTVHQITSEAFGILRKQESQLHFSQQEGSILAHRSSTVDLISHSNGDAVTTTTQIERFVDNAYRIETDGVASVGHQPINAQQMRDYCHELLISTILLPQYITDVTLSQNDTVYRLDFTASETLAQLICSNTCKTLYDDSQLLNALASAYVTDEITAYLEIDILTGLPVAAGIYYSGTHTIQQTAYVLSSRIDQVYDPVSDIDWDALSTPAEQSPSEPVTEATECTE